MRVKFPDGSGGPFDVPGVGRVIGGEPFGWPEDLPPVAGTVPVEDENTEKDSPAADDPQDQPPGKGRARSKE